MGMDNALFSTAYGRRAVPKLAEVLSDEARTDEERVQTLNSLKSVLASQEEKCAAVSAQPSVLLRLSQLILSEAAQVRRLSADCLASLSMVMQGRIAIAEYGLVPALVHALTDQEPGVRTAAAGALHSISNSRDGCSLLSSNPIVEALVAALGAEEAPTLVQALSTLANLLRLEVGVSVALEAGIVASLQRALPLGQHGRPALLGCALRCVFNLACTHEGKAAATNAGLLATIAALCADPLEPEALRLAVGCLMAITVAKEAKLAAECAVAPLCRALADAGAEPFALRAAIGAIKNIAEVPALRRLFAQELAPHGVDMLQIADSATWPESNRYEHQNAAPGGFSAEADRALRAQWGYPEPHLGSAAESQVRGQSAEEA